MDLARIFPRLPYPLKVLGAAWQGRLLQRRRYGPETDGLVAAAHERESWDEARWRHWQEERLAQLLEKARRDVPFYRNLWDRRGHLDPAQLADWPILEKDELRRAPRAFLADGLDPRALVRESTSGSTGTPVELFRDLEAERAWYALFEARCRAWFGVSRHDPWALVGGRLITAQTRRRPPFWVWNRPMRQLYLSAYHLAPDLIPFYREALAKHGVRSLYGYSSALDAMARSGVDFRDLGLAAVLSNAEPLFAQQRENIEKAFGPVARETYGMAELVAAASECPSGGLHLWPEVGVFELVDAEGRAVPDGEIGDIVATSLLNAAQPLIRYRVGDRARRAPASTCACGRRLPLLAALEGRVDDVLLTRDGRAVGRLDPIFKGGLAIVEAQIIQESRERIRLRLVPAPGYGAAVETELKQRLRERLGDVEVVFEHVALLERGANGKFRGVIGLDSARKA